MERVRASLASATADASHAHASGQSQQEALAALKAQLESAKAEIAQHASQSATLSTELATLKSASAEAAANLAAARAGGEQASSAMAALQQKHAEQEQAWTTQLSSAQAEAQRRQEQVVALTAEMKTRLDLDERRDAQIVALSTALDKKAAEIQDIKTNLSLANAEVSATQAELVSELEVQLKATEAQLHSLEERNQGLLLLVNQWETRSAAWDADKAVLRNQRSSLQEQLALLQSEFNSSAVTHAASISKLTQQLSEASKGLLDAHELVEALELKLQQHPHAELSRVSSVDTDNADKLLKLAFVNDRYEQLRIRHAALQTQLQTLRGNILVCCRARPLNALEMGRGERVIVDASDSSEVSFLDRKAGSWRNFTFDRVFGDQSSQCEVFDDVEPIALSVIDGYNACILAYGQTGSGKTYTMQGADCVDPSVREMSSATQLRPRGAFSVKHAKPLTTTVRGSDEGIIQRSILGLFNAISLRSQSARRDRLRRKVKELRKMQVESGVQSVKSDLALADNEDKMGLESIEEDSSFSFTVHVSVLEVYNESVRDLLVENSSTSAHEPVSLELRQSPDGSVSAVGMTRFPVQSAAAALEACDRAALKRKTASTRLNENSSRSHLITLFEVALYEGARASIPSMQGAAGPPASSPSSTGRLYLVDLAGSERTAKSGVEGTDLKDAQYINKSLSALGDVMEALDKRQSHIPYRNSKLTYLLQDAIGGNSRTLMAFTICPSDAHAEETLCTLQFASRIRNISCKEAIKKNSVSGVTVKNLEESLREARSEIQKLKDSKAAVEEASQAARREVRDLTKRLSSAADSTQRTNDEERKSHALYTAALTRTADELRAKLSIEKNTRITIETRVEQAEKELKVSEKLVKEFGKERDTIVALLRQREKELSVLRSRLTNQPIQVEGLAHTVTSKQSTDVNPSVNISNVSSNPASSASPTSNLDIRVFVKEASLLGSRKPTAATEARAQAARSMGVTSNATSAMLLLSPQKSSAAIALQSQNFYTTPPPAGRQRSPKKGANARVPASISSSSISISNAKDPVHVGPSKSSAGTSSSSNVSLNLSARGREALARHNIRMERRRSVLAGNATGHGRKLPGFD